MCKKGTQIIMFTLLYYGIKNISTQGSFFSEINPYVPYDIIILKIFIL